MLSYISAADMLDVVHHIISAYNQEGDITSQEHITS